MPKIEKNIVLSLEAIEGGSNRAAMTEKKAVLIEGRFHCEADMLNEWPDMCIN